MSDARYAVGTWDMDEQAFTPQRGAGRWHNLTRWQLKRALVRLRTLGFAAYRQRYSDGHDGDPCVLVERTNGRTREQILEDWKR